MGKKSKKSSRISRGPREKYRISPKAITQSTGLKGDSAIAVANHIYDIGNETNYGDVVVVTLDIRKWNETIRTAIEFSIEVTVQFLENALPDISHETVRQALKKMC